MTDADLLDLYEGIRMRDANSHLDALRAVFEAGRKDGADEIEHLRAALTDIACGLSPGNRTFDEMMRDCMIACDRARAALAENNL